MRPRAVPETRLVYDLAGPPAIPGRAFQYRFGPVRLGPDSGLKALHSFRDAAIDIRARLHVH